MRQFRSSSRQNGAVAVEFALVSILFVTLLMSIIGFGYWMFTLEMVADATRAGARIAVVCDMYDPHIKAAIRSRVPQLSLNQIELNYLPPGCTKATCQSVQVRLSGSGLSYASWIPFLSAFQLPPFAFTTSLPRESLESTNAAGETNPVCS